MLDYFKKENSTAITFIFGATFWVMIGTLFGLILAIEFVYPDFARGIPALVFSRLRQEHVNTVLFAFLSGGMMGMWAYIVPRLTGRRLWSEPLGNFTAILWNVAVFAGVVSLAYAVTQSREYAELPWVVDWLVIAALTLNLVNIWMTIGKRVEPKLYVSLWLIIGTTIWFPLLYFIGNVMWNPPTGAITGIDDTMFNWFYGHNVLGLWFTTGLLAVIYYVIPREVHTPLYSHVLSLISFWGIAFFYTGVGGHHLLWAPIPYYVKTIAVADSFGMVLPVLAFMLNIFLTMRGNWNRALTSIPLRFMITGWAAYILVSYQGTHQALRTVNELTHFSQYVPAHAHLSLVFFAASVIMGGAYYVIPHIFKCRLFSRRLANAQYALYFVGFATFFVGFTLAGLVQSTNWVHQGLPIWSVLPGIRPFMALRIMGGTMIVASFILFAINMYGTPIARRPSVAPEEVAAGRVTLPARALEEGVSPS